MALGFGTAGIVGGSIAAGIQSIGNVAAGSLFATLTSLGMTGVFASTVAVGAILGGAGGLATYLQKDFDPKKDAELINTVIEKKDKTDILVKLLEFRIPYQIDIIREKYKELGANKDFDSDILNYIPEELKNHVLKLLINDNDIEGNTDEVIQLLDNNSLGEYIKKDFNSENDVRLIDAVIRNKDDPLIIIRLLQYREKKQIQKINIDFTDFINLSDESDDKKRKKKGLYEYAYYYSPDFEKVFVDALLTEIKEWLFNFYL